MHNATLWQFGLAILVLWLVMEYLPEGVYFGAAVLLVTFLSTDAAVKTVPGLLDFIQTGVGN